MLQFLDEDDKPHTVAWIDGYGFGDRLLDGVMFRATIVNNSVKVDLPKGSRGYEYMINNKISIPKWCKVIQESAMDHYDSFTDENNTHDMYLTDVEVEKPADEPLAKPVGSVDFKGLMGILKK